MSGSERIEGDDRVQEFGYVTIGTVDLDAAIDFYTNVVRLEVTERREDEAFLSGGREHYWFRLVKADENKVLQVGMRMADEAALDRARARIEEYGISTVEGGNLDDDRLSRYVRFTDPAGQEIDLYCTMYQRHYPPVAAGIDLVALLHGVWMTPDFTRTWQFHNDVLGIRPSDFMDDMAVWMHTADMYHHGIAVIGAPEHRFQHVCLMVDNIDDVMRARSNALKRGQTLQMDLLRHAPSTSMGLYIEDPMHGFSVEFCARHRQVADDHKPRRMKAALETVNIWEEPLPDIASPGPAPSMDELLAALADND